LVFNLLNFKNLARFTHCEYTRRKKLENDKLNYKRSEKPLVSADCRIQEISRFSRF